MVAAVIPRWRHVYSGKVRDIYVPDTDADAGEAAAGAADQVLLVASDRISAYDHILQPGIPHKGAILTALSLWWFDRLVDEVPHHVVSIDVPDVVAGRAIMCRRLQMYPVECVARGYLAGSGWAEYRDSGTVCGIRLPAGLREGDRLPEPIFTPATKAPQGEHDQNVTFEWIAATHGNPVADRLRELTLQVYQRAHDLALDRGIIIADTKLEFGYVPSTTDNSQSLPDIVLGDEVLTPDSSRFWPADSWEPGADQPSYDKQYVRDWLTSPASEWDRAGHAPPPELPAVVVDQTRARYVQAYESLTGLSW